MTWLGGECVDLGNDAWSEATVEIRSPLGERGRHTSIFSRCELTSRSPGSALHTRPIALASSLSLPVIPSGTSPLVFLLSCHSKEPQFKVLLKP